jgi:phage-related protein
MIGRALLFEGSLYAVVAIRMRAGRSTLYDEFVRELGPADQKKLDRAVLRLADWGLPRNMEKGRALKGYTNLYEIKEHGLRVMWFTTEERSENGRRIVVITHGFRKKQNRTPAGEVERAERLKAEYLETFPQ